jgi:tetratricopeptide (TPR) repeat protein
MRRQAHAHAALGVALLVAAACSAPALDPHLAGAERAERQGEHERALALYDRAAESCARKERGHTCASAQLGRAELLERTGKKREAAQVYESIPALLPDDRVSSATGVYRAGRLYLEIGDDERAYTLLWKTLTDYHDQAFAGDALRAIVRDGRRRNPEQLYQVLGSLIQPLSGTAVGDNLLYALADLAERDRGDLPAALAFHDKIALEYPRSGLRDDALWHAARLARRLGDARGAVRRLRTLLATREVAVGAGSYFSVWLDNAQLELGRVLRDDLGEHRRAADAFALLPRHYPSSILIDDALWELAVTWDRLGQARNACTALSRLAGQPHSRYELERAPALRRKLACP